MCSCSTTGAASRWSGMLFLFDGLTGHQRENGSSEKVEPTLRFALRLTKQNRHATGCKRLKVSRHGLPLG